MEEKKLEQLMKELECKKMVPRAINKITGRSLLIKDILNQMEKKNKCT